MSQLELSEYQSFEHSKVSLKEWQELLNVCVSPSIYMTPEFLLPALEHLLRRKENAKTLVIREASSQQLLGLFFFRITRSKWKLLQFNIAEYSIVDEVDKPYPIMHAEHESAIWKLILDYFLTRQQEWDILDFMELPANQAVFQASARVYQLPRFFRQQSLDTCSPIVDLSLPWSEFASQHKKMRKKINKMSKDFAQDFEFKVYSGTNIKAYLDEYIQLEQKSWKAKKQIGITKNSWTTSFYIEFLSELAKTNSVYFAFIYIAGELVSGEIAYIYKDQVYFSHGSYDPKYKKYSPGMVSTALFIKSLCGQNYRNGDFLGGFAKYIIPWAKAIIKSERVTIINLSPRMIFVLLLVSIKKLLWKPFQKKDTDEYQLL